MQILFQTKPYYIALGSLFIFLSACAVSPTSPPTFSPEPLPRATQLTLPLPSDNAHVLGPEPTTFATNPPLLGSTPIPTAHADVFTVTSPIHSIQIKGYYPAALALDETYIYWVSLLDDKLYRTPINGGENELLATSQFNQYGDGYLFSGGLVRTGDWLIFRDTRLNDTGTWALHALNVKTKQDKVVMQETGSNAPIWSPISDFSADGNWLAWSRLELGNPATCEQSILGMTNLATGEIRELDRTCIAQYMWEIPQLAGNYLVVEQDLPEEQGGKNNIYLWNWTEDKKIALTNNGYSSMPSASEEWVVWKDAPRYTASPNYVIYNLNTNQMESFHAGKNCSTDPKVTGHWLYSPGCGNGFAAYDLENKERVNMVQLPKGQKFRGVLSGKRILWDVVSNQTKQPTNQVQWRTIP